MLTLPYTILSLKLPSNRAGVFLGLFNIFMVIPFIMVPSISNLIIKNIDNMHNGVILTLFATFCFSFILSITIKKRDSEI